MKNLFYTSPKYLQNLKGIKSSASEIDRVTLGSLKNTFNFNSSQYKGKQTVVLLGDSLTAKNNGSYLGRNLDNFTYSTGFISWANALSGQKFEILKNLGVGGETSTQILARVNAVVALNPSHCFFLCGMNDGVTDANTTTLKNNILSIYNTLNSNNIVSVIFTNTTTLNYVDKNKQALEVNEWLNSEFKAKENVFIVDLNSVLINSNSSDGLIKSSVVSDNLHPSNNGGLVGGIEIAKFMSGFANKLYLPTSVLDSMTFSTKSKILNSYPLMNVPIVNTFANQNTYAFANASFDTGVNYWAIEGVDSFKLVQTDSSNTPFLNAGVSTVIGKYYRLDIEVTNNSGYGIQSDELYNVPITTGIYYFKSKSTWLRFKHVKIPSNNVIKINSFREVSELEFDSYYPISKNCTFSVKEDYRYDGIGMYKKFMVNATSSSSTFTIENNAHNMPLIGDNIEVYCELFIHSAENLKDISLLNFVNRDMLASSLLGDDNTSTDILDIPEEGIKLLLRTPKYLVSSTVNSLLFRLVFSFTGIGSVEFSIGRSIIRKS